ncbi:MAG TPA: arylsulfatase [Aquihabitans sp.]|nr:arylsulfatase [Aquihabitans sp.]
MSSTGAPAGPYEGFGGRVRRTFAGSEGWWPERPTPGAEAPNIVIVLADDLGFADLGCYGSEIPTPNLDRLAAGGLQFTNFHVTPMCSPTRAALLTGVDPHRAGAGHVANSDPGFPGYAAELADDVATAAEIFRDAGYATFAVGKWHLTKDSDLSDAGPRHSWPCQRGFDRYYGVLDAFTNLHQPHRLVEDNHTVELDTYPDDYYVTDDLTDRAIDMIRHAKASNPSQPFLCYFAHIAVHAPLQCKEVDLERHRGRYDAGWDALRAERHARQLALGVLPEGTELAPRNAEDGDDVPAWDDLPPEQQRLFARYMEVFAAMVDSIDQSVGRLHAALEELGEADNTIFLFLSDNGASREGEAQGTTAYFRSLVSKNVKDIEDLDADLARIDLAGGPQTLVHYPRGWAMASNTPFRLYKINTHAGGHSVPCILHWPAGQREHGTRDQWAHVTDLLPTLLELTGVERPRERHGVALQPLGGTTLAPVLADPDAPHDRGGQLLEMAGHRGWYEDGWEIVTRHEPLTPFGDHEWELYHLAEDRTELHDLAADHPERVAEMAARWEAAAQRNQVYPLDEGSRLRYVVRPPYDEPLQEPVRIVAGTHTLERYRSQMLIQWRSFDVDVELRYAEGDAGVLVAHGDQGGGYVLYVDEGELRFAHNGYGTMTELACGRLEPGTERIRLAVTAPGSWRWDVRVLVGDEERGRLDDLVMLGAMAPFEGIDVGADRRSPVSWELYARHGHFPWSGDLRAVTFTPGDRAPDAGTNFIDLLREMGLRYE